MLSAELYGIVNGVQTSDSPILSTDKLRLRVDTNSISARASADQSWLWEIPNEWVQVGQLEVVMVIDPQRSSQETGNTANNSVSSDNPVMVAMKGRPCLYYKSVAVVGAAPYYHQAFPSSIDRRAASLLPVQGFRYYYDHTCLNYGHWEIEWEWVPCLPFMCYVGIPVYIEEPFNFSHTNEYMKVFAALLWWSAWEGCPCWDTHFIAAIPEGVQMLTDNGTTSGSSNGENQIILGINFGGNTDWNIPRGGVTLAHELGHDYGRGHIRCPQTGPGMPDPDYDDPPFNPCRFGASDRTDPTTHFGFDPISLSVIRPDMAGDLMSYAPNRWISRFTYASISPKVGVWGFSPVAARSAFSSSQILIHGTLDTLTDKVSSPLPFILADGIYDSEMMIASHDAAETFDPESPYEFILLDSTGKELIRSKVVLSTVFDGEKNLKNFVQFLDFPESTYRLQMVKDTKVLIELQRSHNPPIVDLAPPELDADKETLYVKWSASDADNDDLLCTLQYTLDGGSSWRALKTDYPAFAAAVSTRLLPGGTAAQLRLFVTDGMNTSMVYSEPFVLKTHTPEVAIEGVADGESIPFGVQVQLFRGAYDPEDGPIAPEELQWEVGGRTLSMFDSGETLVLDDLIPGFYEVSLTAVDSDKNSQTATISFEIDPLKISDGAAPVLDGHCGDAAYEDGTSVNFPLRNGGRADVRLIHAGNQLFACFSDLKMGIRNPFGGFTPTIVGLQVDGDGDGGIVGDSDDRGFFVDENGTPFQREGNRIGMIITMEPKLGSNVHVTRGANGWNAEFCIDEALLDGWDHRASIMFVHDALLSTDDDSNWPPGALVASPDTWAAAQFGELAEPAENCSPVAKAGPDQIIGPITPNTVYLDGRASYDPDGDYLEYNWRQISGSPVSLMDAQQQTAYVVVLPVSQTSVYTFELTVSDGKLISSPSQVLVITYPIPRPALPSADPEKMIPPFMTVGDPDNPVDNDTGFGKVGKTFEIGTAEIVNAQYAMFLNAVAREDTNGLFDERMEKDVRGGIMRTGTSGSYSYEIKPYMGPKPVNFLTWLDAARFVNWLENDMQEGAQGPSTTEMGAYDLTVINPGINATRSPNAKYGLPSENQWYKAAYYDPEILQYRRYPFRINEQPQIGIATSSGNISNPGDNVINFANGAIWFGKKGNVTSITTAGAASVYGTYDQGGNVSEWIDGLSQGSSRITRGGSYASETEEISSAAQSFISFDYAGPDVGFRIIRTSFIINNPPSMPSIHFPSDMASVDSIMPILCVQNSTDPDSDLLTYEFEIFSNIYLTPPAITSVNAIPEEDNITCWQCNISLQEDIWYSWRIRATDGMAYSDWASGRFFVSPGNESFEMNLQKSWSMISLPVVPENTALGGLFPEAVVVYGYKKGAGYIRTRKDEDLEVGKGYWILLDQNQNHIFSGQPIPSYTLTVYEEGWEVIGGCSWEAQPTVDNCNIGVIYKYVQGHGYQRLTESEFLMPGKGHWILLKDVEDQCELAVEVIGQDK